MHVITWSEKDKKEREKQEEKKRRKDRALEEWDITFGAHDVTLFL